MKSSNSSRRRFTLIVAAVISIGASSSLFAQLQPPTEASYGGAMPDSETLVPGIAWFGVLEDGLKEAERTGKPIFFVTAAPQCGGVPGMW
jgi:hypothetical protein